MSDKVERFTVSIPPNLLGTFDEVCAAKGYASRSEAIRDAIRNYLIAHEWDDQDSNKEVVGTITLVYQHDNQRLANQLLEEQHGQHDRVLASLHVHLDRANCLEVIVVRGPANDVAALADHLISLRGVKHGRLVTSTVGTDMD